MQKSKKVSGDDQGLQRLKKCSSTFFILFYEHVVAPLGRRNWEPELCPESRLLQRVVAKRIRSGFR